MLCDIWEEKFTVSTQLINLILVAINETFAHKDKFNTICLDVGRISSEFRIKIKLIFVFLEIADY